MKEKKKLTACNKCKWTTSQHHSAESGGMYGGSGAYTDYLCDHPDCAIEWRWLPSEGRHLTKPARAESINDGYCKYFEAIPELTEEEKVAAIAAAAEASIRACANKVASAWRDVRISTAMWLAVMGIPSLVTLLAGGPRGLAYLLFGLGALMPIMALEQWRRVRIGCRG